MNDEAIRWLGLNPVLELVRAGVVIGLDPREMLLQAFEQLLEEEQRP